MSESHAEWNIDGYFLHWKIFCECGWAAPYVQTQEAALILHGEHQLELT